MLAIVIPFYKIAFFDSTLISLSNQNDKRFKVYIGDDGSAHPPRKLLGQYIGKFNLVYHRFENNLGGISLTQHWERCVNLIDDPLIKWLTILGDDDVLDENFVGDFYENVREINELNINVIRYSSVLIDDNGDWISKVYKNPKVENSADFLLRQDKRSSLSEYIFNLQKLKKVGIKDFPLAWFSDNVLILDVSSFGNIYSINTSIVKVRISSLNISGKNDLKFLKDKSKSLFYMYILLNIDKFTNRNNEIYEFVLKYYFKGLNKLNMKLFLVIIYFNLKKFKILYILYLLLLIVCKLILFTFNKIRSLI